MTNDFLSTLDQAELMQLALNASAENDSGKTIAYLKEAVSRADASALAHYILGAEYAQGKLYQRAIEEMTQAVEKDPGLAIARFQLGILWLTLDESARANEVFARLSYLPQDDALYQFAQGMQHLIRNDAVAGRTCILAGLELNTDNPLLNADMQKVLDQLNALEAAQDNSANQPSAQNSESSEVEDAQHIFISAYTNSQERH